ncbi:MAG: penicillin-binding protein 1C [Pseudomonadota bacterium]
MKFFLKSRLLYFLAVVLLVVFILRQWPRPALRDTVASSTAIYAKDNELLRLALASDGQYRVWVPLAEIDPRLAQAALMYEDRWFYWHFGTNPFALLRAISQTYGGGTRQGASTITMQLARRLNHIPSQTVGGKFKQLLAAFWLEARYSKRDILEAYLNLAPYGGNIEGVGAASLIYFHKRPQHLTLPEILALAVIPQNPRRRGGMQNVNRSSAALSKARQRLWQRWVKQYPDAVQYKSEIEHPAYLKPASSLPFRAPHLTDLLVHGDLGEVRRGEIWSSLDLKMQSNIERILAQYINNNRALGITNASALMLDRESGEVRALVGSANYFDRVIDGQVNGTRAKRSPGSTLKPFIYGLALDQGLLHPQTILKDAPTAFGPFSPENFDGRFVGPISAQDALVRSRNVPAVSVAWRLKQPTLYEFLKSAGVSRLASEKHYGLALALGGGELTMEELARLYLMLANRGLAKPIQYTRSRYQANDVQVAATPRWLSDEAAFVTVDMLKTNARPDTGEPAAPAVAWKTGTSWGFRDAWTAGIFGRYVLLVWVGNFDGSGNAAFVGIKTAAPLFFKIVDSVRNQHLDPGEAVQAAPANLSRIEVCRASGDLPNALCKDRVSTWFIPGKSSIKVSNLHRAVKIDRRTGLATCEDGPDVSTEIFEYWPSDMQRLFRDAGMPRRQAPPTLDCGSSTTPAAENGDAPQITSPNRGAVYTMRLSNMTPLALRANAMAANETLFWFANGGLIGSGRAAIGLPWVPAAPGHYQLRVIDSEGRADAREVTVEFIP